MHLKLIRARATTSCVFYSRSIIIIISTLCELMQKTIKIREIFIIPIDSALLSCQRRRITERFAPEATTESVKLSLGDMQEETLTFFSRRRRVLFLVHIISLQSRAQAPTTTTRMKKFSYFISRILKLYNFPLALSQQWNDGGGNARVKSEERKNYLLHV